MKRFFTIALTFGLVFSGFSQITLQQADIASPGDFIEEIAPPFDGDLPPSGPAQTYNFMVDSVGTADTTYFMVPSSTPYGSKMAGANLAAKNLGTYTYYEKDASGFYLRGLVFEFPPLGISVPFEAIPLRFNPRVGILTFPAAIGMNLKTQSTARFRFAYDTVVSVSGVNATVDSVEIVATLKDTSTIDGYGLAQFPSGDLNTLRNRQAQHITFGLRVRAKISIFPALWVDFPIAGLPAINNTSYLFWANGKKSPVATINVDSLGLITDASFQAKLLSITTGVDDLDQRVQFNLSPNPASDYFNWSATVPVKKMQIFSVDGKKIIEKSGNELKAQFSTSQLKAGMYWVEIEDASNATIRKKLIINR